MALVLGDCGSERDRRRWQDPLAVGVYPSEADDSPLARPVDPALVREVLIPVARISGNYNETVESRRSVEAIRRRFRAGRPVRPPTETVYLPVEGSALDTHFDGAHRVEAARRERIRCARVALVFVDKDTEEPVPPPPDWEQVFTDVQADIRKRNEEYLERLRALTKGDR